jgi:hypothetical protein
VFGFGFNARNWCDQIERQPAINQLRYPYPFLRVCLETLCPVLVTSPIRIRWHGLGERHPPSWCASCPRSPHVTLVACSRLSCMQGGNRIKLVRNKKVAEVRAGQHSLRLRQLQSFEIFEGQASC